VGKFSPNGLILLMLVGAEQQALSKIIGIGHKGGGEGFHRVLSVAANQGRIDPIGGGAAHQTQGKKQSLCHTLKPAPKGTLGKGVL
jgi:hypothetical protein